MRKFLLFLFPLFGAAVSAQTVVDIIVDSEAHDTLEAAVVAAGLDDDLSGAGPFTVFAPTDTAFAALPAGTIDFLLDPANQDTLAAILSYHVVADSAGAAELSDSMMLETLQGASLLITIRGDTVMVNDAMVTMADIQASNGIVHVINAVLLPPADTSTSVREPAFAKEVSIAPNPAIGMTVVQLPQEILGGAVLTLRDLSGRTVMMRQAVGVREQLDVSALAAGTYVLQIEATQGSVFRRIVVQR